MSISKWKKRPFFYAAVLTVGFAALITFLENLPDNFFFAGVVILYLTLLFELYSNQFYAEKILDQYELPQVVDKDTLVHNIHHKLFPSLTYFALVGFLYFNHQTSVELIFLGIVFIVYSLLFTNIRAYFEDKYKLEEVTHSVYDILSLIIVFALSNSISHIYWINGQNLLTIILNVLLLGTMSFVILLRLHVFRLKYLAATSILAIAYTVLVFFLLAWGLNILLISFLTMLFYYYLIAYLSHLKDRTASVKVLLEYIVVFLIFLVLIYGIS